MRAQVSYRGNQFGCEWKLSCLRLREFSQISPVGTWLSRRLSIACVRLCGCRGVLLLLLGDPDDVVEPLRDAAEARWRTSAPSHHDQTRVIVHVSLARIVYMPQPSDADDALDAAGEDVDTMELRPEQIRDVQDACDGALEDFGLKGLEFHANALWYAELASADLARPAYQRRFPLRTSP